MFFRIIDLLQVKMDAKARVGAINKLLSSGKLELKTQVHILHIKKYNLLIVVHPEPVDVLVTIPDCTTLNLCIFL